MKTLKINISIVLSIVIISIVGCKKDDEPMVLPPQQAVSQFLDGYVDPINVDNAGTDYSVGYQFIPSVNGKIDQLSINLPAAGDYKVSIWDVDTQTLLRQTTISQTFGNWATKDIPTLSLEGQKTYAISFMLPSGVDYYYANNLTLPIDMTDITVVNSISRIGDGYPVDNIFTNYLFGFIDFTFQADPQ